jgi:hypothetical protein
MMTGFTAAFLAAKRRSSLSSSGDRTGWVDVRVPVVYASGTPIAFGSPCDWAVGVAVGALAVANELSSHALTSLLAFGGRQRAGSCLIVTTVSMPHSPLPLSALPSLRPSPLPDSSPPIPSLSGREDDFQGGYAHARRRATMLTYAPAPSTSALAALARRACSRRNID